jgi:hypothetical protein
LVLHSIDFAAGSGLIQITSDRFKELIATYSLSRFEFQNFSAYEEHNHLQFISLVFPSLGLETVTARSECVLFPNAFR